MIEEWTEENGDQLDQNGTRLQWIAERIEVCDEADVDEVVGYARELITEVRRLQASLDARLSQIPRGDTS